MHQRRVSSLTRFAPAPTGYLHLGHVANALYVWHAARSRGARVLLRIEDHDRQRCRPEYEQALLDDLDWLGFVPDLGTTGEFRRGPSPYRQSDCDEVYRAHIELLRQRGHHVYACDCSRTDIADAGRGDPVGRPYMGRDAVGRGDSMDRGDSVGRPYMGRDAVGRGDPVGRPYGGRCRDRGLTPGPGRGLRVVLPPGVECFNDLRLGPQSQKPARQCGDLLLRDRLGNWTYQFAVVVDDLRHGVDLVVRGEDLLNSTGRQLSLARLLGRSKPPAFLHHPVILKPSGDKLSKAGRDTSVRDLRDRGATPGELLGHALRALGRRSAGGPVTLEEGLALLDPS